MRTLLLMVVLFAIIGPAGAQARAEGLRVAIEIADSSQGRIPPNACYRIDSLCDAQGWEDSIVAGSDIDDSVELEEYDVVVTGDVGYNDNDFTTYQAALKQWVRGGGGFVSLGWAVYGVFLAKAWDMDSVMPVRCSLDYGFVTSGTVRVVDSTHAVTVGVRDFGVYSHGELARAGLREGAVMLGDYSDSTGQAAIAAGEFEAGRSVYLGPIYFANFNGYNNEPYYDDADAMRLLKQAIEWVAGDTTGIGSPTNPPARQGEQLAAAPSPFEFETVIQYALPGRGRVTLAVYDRAGNRVKTIVSANLEAGTRQVRWNRTDDAGRPVAGGVYFCRLEAPGVSLSRKLVAR